MTQIHVIRNELGDVDIPILVTNSTHFNNNENGYQQVYSITNDVEVHDFAFL